MKKIIALLILATLFIGCGKTKNENQIQGKIEKEQIAVVSKIPVKF
jgi:HlyD family secretion protein